MAKSYQPGRLSGTAGSRPRPFGLASAVAVALAFAFAVALAFAFALALAFAFALALAFAFALALAVALAFLSVIPAGNLLCFLKRHDW